MPRKVPRQLTPELRERIWYLRQKEYLPIPEIVSELEEFGVRPADVTAHGGPAPKNRPKTKAEIASIESSKVYSDDVIAKHYGIDVKDVTETKRNSYRTLLHSRKGSTGAFGSSVNKLRKEIRRVFPDDHAQILFNGKKQASLEEIFDHPLFQEEFGKLTNKATGRGKKGGLKLDEKTGKFVRNRRGTDALNALRGGIVKLYPRPPKKLLAKLEDMRNRGLSFDSEEVQKLIRERGGKNFQSLIDRANVYSWETVGGNDPKTGKPVGNKVPGSKKKVANLLFGNADDLKGMRVLADDLVRDQIRGYFRTGKLSQINHLDHIFPHGSPRIVNGQLFGGAIDELGKFRGVGITGLQNLRKLLGSKNMSLGNILSPERIKLLEGLEFDSALSVAETQEGLKGRTDAQARYDARRRLEQLGRSQAGTGRPPRFRWGGYAIGGFLGLLLAPWSEKGYTMDQFKETVKDPWYWADMFSGMNTRRAANEPSRLLPSNIGATIAEDTIVPLGQMIAGGLSSDDILQEPYYGMGSQRGLLDTGHYGIGEERQNRRTNIWT